MTDRHNSEADPIRQAIIAAMDRMLDGSHERSTGRLSVAQLAAEAGVKRWLLTHRHTDLKDLFQARVGELDGRRGERARAADAFDKLKGDHRELQRYCAGLEERVRLYATSLNLLMLENAALAGKQPDAARLLPFPRPGAANHYPEPAG